MPLVQQSTTPPLLLFVDDEPDIIDIAKMCFEKSGWGFLSADNIHAAKDILRCRAVDAVLSDIMMSGGTGLELLDWVRQERGGSFIFYLLTGCIDERISLALDRGAHGVFNKPCDWATVVKSLSDAVERPC